MLNSTCSKLTLHPHTLGATLGYLEIKGGQCMVSRVSLNMQCGMITYQMWIWRTPEMTTHLDAEKVIKATSNHFKAW